MQTEFVRSLNCNFERVLLDKKPEEKRYQYCIMNRGGIRGLLPCSLRYINGLAYLYYDISSKQSMKQLYSTRCITRVGVKDFLWSLRQMRQELDRFLLDGGNILFFPEQIFQDLESSLFSFVYMPYYRDAQGDSGFKELMEFFAERIDYNDEKLVECIYHMYEQVEESGEVYLQARIFEDAKILEEPPEAIQADAVLGDTGTGKEEAGGVGSLNDRNPAGEMPPEGAAAEPKRHFFGLFEGRRKSKSREFRENYRQDMQDLMNGGAVAEDTVYESCGKTTLLEENTVKKSPGALCTPGGKVLAVIGETGITIGKRRGEADLVLDHAGVSRLHARIVREGDSFFIEDLNSTNGTFKNGLRLQPYEKRELEEGDEIGFGQEILIFR